MNEKMERIWDQQIRNHDGDVHNKQLPNPAIVLLFYNQSTTYHGNLGASFYCDLLGCLLDWSFAPSDACPLCLDLSPAYLGQCLLPSNSAAAAGIASFAASWSPLRGLLKKDSINIIRITILFILSHHHLQRLLQSRRNWSPKSPPSAE